MPLPLIIVCVLFGVVLFVVIPLLLVHQQYQIKKRQETHHIGLIVHRTGVSGHFVEMPRDREECTDTTKTPSNPTGKPITYFTKEGYSINVTYPPHRNRLMQGNYPLSVWVEKDDRPVDMLSQTVGGVMAGEPVDLLRQFREHSLTPVESSEMVANIRKEKITNAVIRQGDAIDELLDRLEKGTRSPVLWYIVCTGILAIGLIAVTWMLKGSIGEVKDGLNALTDNFNLYFGNWAMP